MTTFFIELWHDLREKRLWPVAVGLVAAIVAVPVILFKPASDAAPAVTSTPKTNAADTLPVVSVDAGPTQGSRLEAFDEKNPFKPMKDLAKEAEAGDDKGADAGDGSGDLGSGAGGSLADPDGGSSAGGTGGTPSTGGTTPSSGGTGPTMRWFRYVADFSFGPSGEKATKFDDVAKLTLLPDEANPSIVFIGLDGDDKSAVFFINDPAFVAEGEGECNAKGVECRFVKLKLSDSNDEETFSAIDGSVSYDLKLLDIRRAELPGDPEKTPAAPKRAKGLGATGAGVETTTAASQSVLPTFIPDAPTLTLQSK